MQTEISEAVEEMQDEGIYSEDEIKMVQASMEEAIDVVTGKDYDSGVDVDMEDSDKHGLVDEDVAEQQVKKLEDDKTTVEP